MNKTKKELYEENKKLKEEQALYNEYWHVDVIKEQRNTLLWVRRILYGLSIILLCGSCFIGGLLWR